MLTIHMRGAGSKPLAIAPPGPKVRLLDNFVDVNGTSLAAHTMDVGPGWTIVNGTWTIQGNAATQLVNGGQNVVVSEAGIADGVLTGNWIAGNPYDGAFSFNFVDSSNYWLVSPEFATGLLRLYSNVAGSFTLVASINYGFATGTTYAFEIDISGDTVRVIVNTFLQFTYTAVNRPLKTATKHGLRCGADVTSSWTQFKFVG